MKRLNENEKILDGLLTITESYNITSKKHDEEVKNIVTEAKESGMRLVLRPKIAAIHAGWTKNNNIYPAEKLKGDLVFKPYPTGVHSLTKPYPKPMLKNHDTESEPTGRVLNAQYVKDAMTGKEMIVIIPSITDPDTIEKVLDGRYMTVSIGASTDSATCNICGKDIINEGWCDHYRGEEYDGIKCGWIVGNIWFNEVSWVNVPADSEAMVIDCGEVQTMESYMQVNDEYYDLSGESGIKNIKESASILGISASVEETNKEDPAVSEKNKTLSVEEFDLLSAKAEKATELETLIVEKDAKIVELETSITEKDTEFSNLTGEKVILESQVAALDAEKQALVDQNVEANANMHSLIVETVTDLKIALSKPGVDNREDAITSHSTRTNESLLDTLKDLLSEMSDRVKSINMITAYKSTVSNPGLSNEEEDQKPGSKESSEPYGLSKEQILINLMKGVKKSKGGNK